MSDLNGIEIQSLRFVIPQRGVAETEVVFADDVDPEVRDPGLDVLTIDGVTFSGTFTGGKHEGERTGRFVLGANGWAADAGSRAYHNDAGVTAAEVVSDLASEIGETVDLTPLQDVRLGVDFVRTAGPASEQLSRVAPGWHIDRAGTTQFAIRESVLADVETYRVLEFNSRTRIAMLDIDDLAAIDVGSQIIVEGEADPLTIRTLIYTLDSNLSVEAWCGGDDSSESDMLDLLRSIVDSIVARKLFGLHHYRVAQHQKTRVDLQPVDPTSGLPTLTAVEIWTAPGISSSDLTLGVECGVQFLDGNPARPVVTCVAGAFQDNHSPNSLDLGGPGGSDACSVGDLGSVFLPGVIPVSGTVGGVPFVGVMTITSAVTCVLQTGSRRVRLKK